MEFEIPSFPSLLSVLVIFITLIAVLLIKKISSSKDLPPGPWRLPVIGNFQILLGSGRPHERLYELAKKYGPVMHLQLGEVTSIVVSTADIAREIIKNHDLNFASKPYTFATDIISYNFSDISFSPYNEAWVQRRKVCMLDMLNAKRVQMIKPIRDEEIFKAIRSISSCEGSTVNLREITFNYNINVILRASYGNQGTKDQQAFLTYLQEVSEVAEGFYIADLFPSFKFLYTLTGLKAKCQKVHREFDEVVENIINDHKLKRKMPNNNQEPDEDLVDGLLNLLEKQHLGPNFTMNHVKAVLMDIFNAGTEGPALGTEWVLAELMRNPSMMKKAQEEVRQVFDKKGYVDEADLTKLNYMKAVIKETLRLHPPGSMLLPRVCQEEREINGYRFPKKCKVMINTWAIGRDPNYWKEPLSFIPERFLDGEIDYKGNHFEFLPFGSGRRMCPGMTFGMINLELPLANLLYYFDWTLPNGMKPNDVDMTEGTGIVVRLKEALCLIPTVARPLPVVA